MKKNERNAVELDWDVKDTGRFEAVIVNGELKHMMGIGASGSVDIYSNDYKFLLALREAINELEAEVKVQLTRAGKNGATKPMIPVVTPLNTTTS